ncbi:acyltransferase family protein [Aeromicrobium yanjiei]|uniref:Acyltransferase family protein n=1 Tax=Aeromicrobium yanjiei TaxID=2662028 RepID=A0A5Q2MF06_9ACTN|nr:acyltransferase family protein [Aeromicrobium yanjiei]QGG40299.1 acyltransferase family protein [Aeromicrobium yanjiei]
MAAVTGRHRAERPTRRPDHGRTLRLDIEGMRAIAVVAVLLFHAGLPWAAGGFVGVDVFFVLSGFLITGLLAREISRSGRIRIGTFWARRVKRLLPAGAVVLVFSAVVAYVYLPITQRDEFGGDIVAAALYVVNWRLAERSVDYLAEDVGASPVQHYWSLSVEEQFYVLWPLLMLAVAVLAARRWRGVAFGVLGLVTAASFAWSVVQSHSHPGTAFFVSTTRVWELGVGALLALAATRVAALPAAVRAAGGWVGLALIAYAVLVFDAGTTWPGANALVPTVGAALMIASGLATTPGSPQRMLSLAPMVWIGGLSYSIYLWHWPVLVAAQAHDPDLAQGWVVALVLASIAPAWLCHRLIENPVRFGAAFRSTGRALGLGAALTAAGVAAGLVLATSSGSTDLTEATLPDSPGAAILETVQGQVTQWSDLQTADPIRPLPGDAERDMPPPDEQRSCQTRFGDATARTCVFGDPDGDRTVVITGDSKMQVWLTALDDIAADEGWRLVQLTKSGCAFADHTRGTDIDRDCLAWGRAALRTILDLEPDLVITSQRHGTAYEPGTKRLTQAAMVDGLSTYWGAITARDIPLVTILDNPSPDREVHECVAQHPFALDQCAFDKERGIAVSAAAAQRAAADRVGGVGIVDLTDVICPDAGRCAPVIGNVLAYRQGTHLTRSYVDSMRPQLAAALARATDGALGAGDGRPRSG